MTGIFCRVKKARRQIGYAKRVNPCEGYWHAWQTLGNDIRLPLFAVLLGRHLRRSDQMPASRGELLNEVVCQAIKKCLGSIGDFVDRLCLLAVASTDRGGSPIPARDLQWSYAELSSLCRTRLVAEINGCILFPVASIRLWFAAEALNKGFVDLKIFAEDRGRLFSWNQALSMFLATQNFDVAARLMEGLAMRQPALAAHLVRDAFREDQIREINQRTTAEEFGQQAIKSIQSRLIGLGNISHNLSITDKNGNLLPMKVAVDKQELWLAWIEDETLPALTSVSYNDMQLLSSYVCIRMYPLRDQAAHVWGRSLDIASSELKEVLKRMIASPSLLDEVFLHEYLWNAIVGVVRKRPGWFDHKLSWDEIAIHEPLIRALGCWAPLEPFRALHPDGFFAPHPPADILDFNINPTFYSADAAIARERSVIRAAMNAYQRIVRTHFPRFVDDLKYSAWWPARLIGDFGPTPDWATYPGWSVKYRLEPVANEVEATVDLTVRTPERLEEKINWEEMHSRVRAARPGARENVWTSATICNLHDLHPATSLVFTWLTSDLTDAGWSIR